MKTRQRVPAIGIPILFFLYHDTDKNFGIALLQKLTPGLELKQYAVGSIRNNQAIYVDRKGTLFESVMTRESWENKVRGYWERDPQNERLIE